VLPPAAAAAPGLQSGRWGAGGCADQLPDTAGATAADGGELPEGAASLVRGGERRAVRLLGVGHVLGGVLYVGEHVFGGTAWRPRARGLRARGRGRHGLGCGVLQGEHRRQGVEERQGREPLALLEIREMLGCDRMPQQGGAALGHGLEGQVLGVAGLLQAWAQRGECGQGRPDGALERRGRLGRVDHAQPGEHGLQGGRFAKQRPHTLDVGHTDIARKGADGLRPERGQTERHHQRIGGAPVPGLVMGDPHRQAVHRVLGHMFDDAKAPAIGVEPMHDVVPRGLEAPMAQQRILAGDLGLLKLVNGRNMVPTNVSGQT